SARPTPGPRRAPARGRRPRGHARRRRARWSARSPLVTLARRRQAPRSLALFLVRLHGEPHRRPLLVVELQLDERRDRDEAEPVRLYVRPGDGDGLDRLVDGMGTDGLDLHLTLVS